MDPLVVALRRLRRRLLTLLWFRSLTWWLMVGACLACVWLLLTRLFPQLGTPEEVCLGAVAAACAVGTLGALRRRPSLMGAALAADRQLNLKERLTSSYELAGRSEPMFAALHADARRHLENGDLRKAFPLQAPANFRWLAAPVLAFAVVHLFMPEFDLLGYRERQEQAEALARARRVHADLLRNAARPLKEDGPEAATDLSSLAQEVERIAEGVDTGEITDRQAVAQLSDLAKDLADQRERLAAESPTPELASDSSQFGMAADVANALQNEQYADAAEQLRELQEKLESGEMSGEEAQKLAADLKKLAENLGNVSPELQDALAKAAGGIGAMNMSEAAAALEAMQMSLEDLASMSEQLAAIDKALSEFGRCQCELLGKQIAEGLGSGAYGAPGNVGLRGPGQGRGGRIGDLPDTEGALEATMLSGDMTKGRILATIMQRAAPDESVESTLDVVSEAFVEVQQQAEQALTKEEIPPGAREFVRQYFGSLEPEGRARPARPAQPEPGAE
ncbi:MAG: hypothetical protein JXR94_23825 [Candidatus Hydrogenedentes bacterium]|nr:hypothetical protein [Candidatus Hydrogenedentota bacterium]